MGFEISRRGDTSLAMRRPMPEAPASTIRKRLDFALLEVITPDLQKIQFDSSGRSGRLA
jgi:hypothetical protein